MEELIERIEEGTTTVEDADVVRKVVDGLKLWYAGNTTPNADEFQEYMYQAICITEEVLELGRDKGND